MYPSRTGYHDRKYRQDRSVAGLSNTRVDNFCDPNRTVSRKSQWCRRDAARRLRFRPQSGFFTASTGNFRARGFVTFGGFGVSFPARRASTVVTMRVP